MSDLKQQVQDFNLMELPGQPRIMHMGTSYLVNDLWKHIAELEARFDKLYTNCPATPTVALRRNPHMLGDDDDKCWMQADLVFAITHPDLEQNNE